jgi:hypothetical protein
MRIIDPREFSRAKLQPHESFFVELWYSMTHAQSLDSYRVKCMNSRSISRELSQELRIGLLLKKEQIIEFTALCSEVEKLLHADPVCSQTYPAHLRNIFPLLEKFRTPATKEDKDRKKDLTELQFAVDDLLADMHRSYFRTLCDLLKSDVGKKNIDSIRRVTAALLTDLVDQGWDLDSLYRWHLHLLARGNSNNYSFSDNVDFMLRKLQRGPQSFDVILRLSGSPRLKDVPEFGGFAISEASPTEPEGDAGKHFVKQHDLTCFARKEVEALDFLPAAISARQAFETQLDLLRFDYERRVVNIEDTCYVSRVGDKRSQLLTVQMGVPNPVETIDLDGLIPSSRPWTKYATSHALRNLHVLN